MLWLKRRVTGADIADKLDVSYGYAYSIIHEDCGNHKICARWVPKQLIDEHDGHAWKYASNF